MTLNLPNDPRDPRIPRFLALARTPRLRLIDLLLDDLHDAGIGAPARLQALLAEGPVGELGSPQVLLIEGAARLEDLIAIKERSKRAMHAAPEAPLAPLAAYFAAVGAALAHHGALICSRSRADLEPVLIELAAAAGAPWSDLFQRAILAP